MKKLLLCFAGILLLLSGKANAQSDSLAWKSKMKRDKFRLAIVEPNGMDNEIKQTVLKKEQLQLLLSDNQFSTYNHARRCYHASIPLLSLAACGLVGTCFFLGVNIHDIIDHPNLYHGRDGDPIGLGFALAGVCFASTSLFLIPGVTLNIHSIKKLNQIAEDYHRQNDSSFYQNDIRLNFGFTPNGIGVKLNF